MTRNDSLTLHNRDDEDIFDVVVKLEKSFGISFPRNAFEQVNTFGDLCAVFEQHLTGEQRNDCTSQQAFYRIRSAISLSQGIDEGLITPDSQLESLFPRQHRRRRTRAFLTQLGISVDLLTYPGWLGWLLATGILLSLAAFFFNWKIATGGIAVFSLALWLAQKTAKEFKLQTLRELTQQLTHTKYKAVRRHKGTVNKKEIRQIITDTFSRDLDIDPVDLAPGATFAWAVPADAGQKRST